MPGNPELLSLPESTGKSSIKQQIRSASVLILVIILTGVLLRIYFYLVNRSLWLDEAFLAASLVNRSFAGLFQPLEYAQGAPPGFLLAAKTAVVLFGKTDYSLRLIPLLAGVASVPLMAAVAHRYSARPAAMVASALFALSPRLIYYSSEVKQYSTDVFFALLLLYTGLACLQKDHQTRCLALFGAAGIIAVWMSHPALFVWAAVALALGLTFIKQNDTRRLLWLAGAAAVWTVNLAAIYFISLQDLAANKLMLNYWHGAFAPMPPWSDINWYQMTFANFLIDPIGLPNNLVIRGLLLIGAASLAYRIKTQTAAIFAPFVLALIASALDKYPFSGRLLLFTAPLIFLIAGEGINRLRLLGMRASRPLAYLTFAVCSIYLLYTPALETFNRLLSPPMGEHIKPVMAYIQKNRQPNDLVYVYYSTIPAFNFYAAQYGFGPQDYYLGVFSRDYPNKYIQELSTFKGRPRAWFVFSHNCIQCQVNEEEFILAYLDQIGRREDAFLGTGATAYLYDLSSPP